MQLCSFHRPFPPGPLFLTGHCYKPFLFRIPFFFFLSLFPLFSLSYIYIYIYIYMDSVNSGSISSSSDEEYGSRADHSVFLNHPTHFGSSHHPSMFDLSSTYLHSLPQSQPTSSTPQYSLLNLDTASSRAQRSELATCTDRATLPSSSGMNHSSMLGPHHHQALPHDDNARVLLSSSSAPTNNNVVARNSKKRTRASRRAPTTVLTTDTTNFRSMVQEFTGIPSPPFSASSCYSRRLDLLATSSSLRSGASHLDTTNAFHPFRPFAQKVHPNPMLNSRLLHSNMVDAMASATTNTSSSATVNNSVNFHLPPDLGLPYHQPQNMNLSLQNNPTLAFNPAPITLHAPFNTVPAGFGAKSPASLSMPSLEDLQGMSHGQVNTHMVAATGESVQPGHEHVASEGIPLRGASDDGRRDQFRSLDGKVASAGGSCKLHFSASASSSGLNHEKLTLENGSTRGEGTVDSWICSSD